MKITGKTNEGNDIIEFTPEETRELNRLCFAVEGKTISEVLMYDVDRRQYTDLPLDTSTVFSAVKVFYMAKFKVNELTDLVDELNRAVMSEKVEYTDDE